MIYNEYILFEVMNIYIYAFYVIYSYDDYIKRKHKWNKNIIENSVLYALLVQCHCMSVYVSYSMKHMYLTL